MASGYSQPGSTYRHLNPVDVYDEQLVATVLGAKQSRYDKNLATIDAALEQYGGVDLARTKDKQYLQDKLTALTDQVNGAGMQDLSSSAVTRSITQHIDQALDDNVLEQMANTQKIRNFGADVEGFKKKNDGSYAKQNEAYALEQAGFSEYMTGGKDALGNLEYNPYVDVAKAQREILDESFSVDKGITRKIPDSNGYFIESTHHGLTQSEVRAKVSSSLNPQELKQLEIDAWAKYGESAPQRYEQYVSPKINELKEERSTLMLNYDGLTPAEKASVNEKVAFVDSTIKEIGSLKDNSQALYRFLGKEDLIGGLANTYSPVETNLSYSSDASFYKEQENTAKLVSSAIGRGDDNQDGIDDVTTRSLVTDPDDNWIPTQKAEEELKTYESDMRSVFNQSYNRLSEQDKTAFNNGYKQYLSANGLTDNPANKTTFMLEKSNSSKGNYFTPLEYSTAKNMEREYREKLEIKNTNYKEALAENEANNLNAIFTNLKDTTENGDIMVLNENGKKVSGRQYLQGINNIEQLSEAQKKILLKSVYSDATLSQSKDFDRSGGKDAFNISRLAGVNGEVGKDLPMVIIPDKVIASAFSKEQFESDFEGLKEKMQLPKNLTKEQFVKEVMPSLGERDIPAISALGRINNSIPIVGAIQNIAMKTFTNMVSHVVGSDPSSAIIVGGQGTETRKDLEKALKNGLYDKFAWADDSVQDDSTISRALNNQDNFQKSYEAKMAEDAGKFAQNQEIIVQSSGTRKGTEVAAFEDLRRFAAFEKGKAIYVRKSDVEGMYEAYQVEGSVTVKNGEAVDKSTTISTVIAERDLVGNPFFDNITKQKSARRITSENTKELISGSAGFADEKDQRKYIVGLSEATGITNEKQLAKFTSQGAKRSLIESHPQLFSDEEAGLPLKTLVKTAIDNSHIFRLNTYATDTGRFDMAIQYPVTQDGKKVWKNLKVLDTGTKDITETVKMIDIAPQTFIYEYMNRLLTNIEINGAEGSEDDIKLLQKILLPQ